MSLSFISECRFHGGKFIFVALAIFGLSACSGGSSDDIPDNTETAPQLVSTSPVNGATGLDAGSLTVTVTFDQAISLVNADRSKFTIPGATVAGVQTAATGGVTNKLVVELTGLSPATTYVLTVPADAVKGEGALCNARFTLSFTTKAASPAIATTLCDKSATAKTQRLYAFLLSVYGSKCLSGTIANVAWNHTEADNVFKITGRYPAINCFDFIHIYYSPASWIDYNNITPVTEWDAARGIVSLMWHFNVPKKEGSADLTCSTDQTTFSCSNVFVSGTWENVFFYQQMDKVCSVLLKLQQAGIAALWRPFHEAAGNVYAKTYKGTAWFWWGAAGSSNYVKLWKCMYDYFQAKGIHNLIWIWTTQNYNGDSSSYGVDTNYYPGDSYVDIVGRDIYGYGADKLYDEWKTVSAFYPNKMVALAECGNSYNASTSTVTSYIANMSEQWSKGCRWLYFMPWYDYNYDTGASSTNFMCSDGFWKDAMAQSYILKRGDVNY